MIIDRIILGIILGIAILGTLCSGLLALKQESLLPLFKKAADLNELELGRLAYAAMGEDLKTTREALQYAVKEARRDAKIWGAENLLLPSALLGGITAPRKGVTNEVERAIYQLEDLFTKPGERGFELVKNVVACPETATARKGAAIAMIDSLEKKFDEVVVACKS